MRRSLKSMPTERLALLAVVAGLILLTRAVAGELEATTVTEAEWHRGLIYRAIRACGLAGPSRGGLTHVLLRFRIPGFRLLHRAGASSCGRCRAPCGGFQ